MIIIVVVTVILVILVVASIAILITVPNFKLTPMIITIVPK